MDSPLDSPLRRVAVVGCCGAGKSTLAARLAPALGLPLVHLDREYWNRGWIETPNDEWLARHAELIAEHQWVIDGNYRSTLRERAARADLVIVLDVPSLRALWRVLRRAWRDRGESRPDMADGCIEGFFRLSNFGFYWYVLRFNRAVRPHTRRLLEQVAPDRTVVVRSRADADALVAQLAAVR